MTTRVIDLFLDPDVHASRPAAASVPVGSLFPCTTHNLVERNDDGTTWSNWTVAAGGLGEAAIVALVNDDTTPSALRAALDAIYTAGGFSGDGIDLTGGPVPTAVLGSGTADGTTFLRGDQTWAIPAGGGGSVSVELAPVVVAATGNVNLSTDLVNGNTIDGVTLATLDRVLCPIQNTGSQNGIYVVVASGAASRSTDADTTGDLVTGNHVYIKKGSAAGSVATLTNTGTITIGTTVQAWSLTPKSTLTGNSGLGYGVSVGPGAKCTNWANVAIGYNAGGSNGIQYESVVIGSEAANNSNANGANATVAMGYQALKGVTGGDNTAIGHSAGNNVIKGTITSGSQNTHVGRQASGNTNTSRGTSLGYSATSHTDATALGSSTETTQTFQTHTGPRALAMKKMATPHTTSGNANDAELMVVDDGSGNLILKAILDSKIITLAHELGTTHLVNFATGSRPSASAVGAGAVYYDTTLSKPGFSDGTNWKDAAGTTI